MGFHNNKYPPIPSTILIFLFKYRNELKQEDEYFIFYYFFLSFEADIKEGQLRKKPYKVYRPIHIE